ncbi:MAG: hydroxymethylbilane synthase [Deltaproteobacteria bacterium]|nr:hydroxymethylbilane synthase [Deltaproteobacteria bacterium]
MNLASIKIATRGSALALVQANWVKSRLESQYPDLAVELEIIKTRGDRILDVSLAKIGGKGLFVKEIEEALMDGRADLAVHSMKDVPTELPAPLVMAAVTAREDFRDVLITRQQVGLDDLPRHARIGTSSLRRQAQLLHLRPDLTMAPLRGNVETRLKKLESENLDAVILAAAGLIRMNLIHRITQFLEPDFMLPAVGQGALGLEVRARDEALRQRISFLNHEPTAVCVKAERAFLRRLEGGCQVPVAALGLFEGKWMRLTGLVADAEGRRYFRHALTAEVSEAESLGQRLAQALLDRGAGEILAEALPLSQDRKTT